MTNSPLISVIIPAYDQAEYLADALQSVLNQTYQHFEIIVVNDASPDNTDKVMEQFTDARINYIVHEQNLRLSAARNTGIKVSRGEFIALLDADDMFHPEKLQMHVDFLKQHPGVGVTYNARFDLNHSLHTVQEIFRPPTSVGLKELILGFPFSPSDLVIRKELFSQFGLFDPNVATAEDTDFPCRLALAGCQFAGIDRALNYRRHHSGRGRKNLAGRLNDVKLVLEKIFSDPRCPASIKALKHVAIKEHLMAVVSMAFIQEETQLGQEFLLELVGLDPQILKGTPSELVSYFLMESIDDDTLNHETVLQKIFSQLPHDLASLSSSYNWAVARGYLWKGARAAIWDRPEDAQRHFTRALELKASVDAIFLQSLTQNLLNFENEFGLVSTLSVLDKLSAYLNQIPGLRWGNKLRASYLVSRAFQLYHAGLYIKVPGLITRALRNDLSYLGNRGVISIFIRSMMRSER